MKTGTLSEITRGEDWVGLGIAGNQAEHLVQAGEADDFKDVSAAENAPKGLFPWYIKGRSDFLGTNPLSSDILSHNGEDVLQPEPEVALVVELHYGQEGGQLLQGLKVIGFSAFNDCSRRVAAPKISLKKNWGSASQGMAAAILAIDDFNQVGGTIDHFRIACYLKRDESYCLYGKDTAVTDYCYFNHKLVDWIVAQINHQHDHGPLEAISDLLSPTKPKFGVIGIGATCYSEFGNSTERYLQVGDEVIVCLYNARHYSAASIQSTLINMSREGIDSGNLIVLRQNVI